MSAASDAYSAALGNHFNAKKYGLTKTSASKADLDKGIVEGPGGSFYKIDGFKHGQEDGLDQDKATSAFDGALEAAGRKAGFDPSTFNTAGDVQNAINAIGEGAAPKEEGDRTYKLSETAAKAKAYTAAYEDEFLPNAGDYMIKNDQDVRSDFMNAYKLNLAKNLKPVTPDGSTRPSKVQEEKDKVAGKE